MFWAAYADHFQRQSGPVGVARERFVELGTRRRRPCIEVAAVDVRSGSHGAAVRPRRAAPPAPSSDKKRVEARRRVVKQTHALSKQAISGGGRSGLSPSYLGLLRYKAKLQTAPTPQKRIGVAGDFLSGWPMM
jgi:hypothetical protein